MAAVMGDAVRRRFQSLQELESRQESILSRLSELQGRVDKARCQLGLHDNDDGNKTDVRSHREISFSLKSSCCFSFLSQSPPVLSSSSLTLSPLDLKRKSELLDKIERLKVTLRGIREVWQRQAEEIEESGDGSTRVNGFLH